MGSEDSKKDDREKIENTKNTKKDTVMCLFLY
jgi:hypothetical protein